MKNVLSKEPQERSKFTMNVLLKIESIAFFFLGAFLFSFCDITWWWFGLLFFAPDIGMVGYLRNPKIGAFSYNLFHHYGVAIGVYFMGYHLENNVLSFIGALLISHNAFDRFFGFGLKYADSFNNTHLGKIGIKN